MIPKVIHYCWFGRNPKPKIFKKCLKSWKKYCPDYKIVEWNEETFDIYSNIYTKQAYESKKWAFVTDYVRLYVLYHYGGVYMDTDVEVIKPIDRFLIHEAFSGFENPESIPTGIMASEKENALMKQLLDYYIDRPFIVNGKPDLTTNVKTITNLLSENGFLPNNQFQIVRGFALYPFDYFCPHDYKTGILTVTENTYTIHHFAGSWLPEEVKKKEKLKRRTVWLRQHYGDRVADIYSSMYYADKHNGGAGYLVFFSAVINRRVKRIKKGKREE